VNERRGQNRSPHRSRRSRHHSSTACPQAGRSFIRISGRSFTTKLSTPHTGHGRLTGDLLDDHLDRRRTDPLHKQDAELAPETE
jgi:hypothetical protein